MVPWDFGSPSPRAKFVSYVHGYTCTSKDWFLLFTYKIVYTVTRWFVWNIISVCTTCILRLFPTRTTQAGTHLQCYHRNRNILIFYLIFRLLPTCYHRNKIKAGKILVITKGTRVSGIYIYTARLKIGSHAWDLYIVHYFFIYEN